jgi:hypothetical protein
MGSAIKLQLTIGEKFGLIFRAGVKLGKPIVMGDGAITIGLPPLGAVTIYFTQKEKITSPI